jgi:hypothetical protein
MPDSKQARINIYIPDEREFLSLIYAAAIVLEEKGYKLSQHDNQAPSKSAVILAALREVVKEYKKGE